jgi:CTP synthase
VSVNEALKHAGAACNVRVNIDWIETKDFEKNPTKTARLSEFDGVLVPGGFGQRGTYGKIAAIKYARENNKPYLGICFGFQLAVAEFAQDIGYDDANSTEVNSKTKHPVIDLMPEQKDLTELGATMRLGAHEIKITPNTLLFQLYHNTVVKERHRHRYEVNLRYVEEFQEKGLVFSGKSIDGKRMEVLEIPSNYFFLATQFHAEFKSRPNKPSPPYYGFIKACCDNQQGLPQPIFKKVN